MSSNFIPTSFAILSLMIVCMYYSLTLLRCCSDDLKNFVMTRQWREVHKFPHLSFLTKDQLDDVFMSFPSQSLSLSLALLFLLCDWHFSQLLGKDKQVVTLSLSLRVLVQLSALTHPIITEIFRRTLRSGGQSVKNVSNGEEEVSGAIFTAANE